MTAVVEGNGNDSADRDTFNKVFLTYYYVSTKACVITKHQNINREKYLPEIFIYGSFLTQIV